MGTQSPQPIEPIEPIKPPIESKTPIEPQTPKRRSSSLVLRLSKIIVVLVILIVILLYLIFKFGLGGGNGSLLPGNGNKDGGEISTIENVKKVETKTETIETKVETPDKTISQDNSSNDVKIPIRFELIISFETDPANPDNVKEFACNIEKIDTSKKDEDQKKVKPIVCNNMSDFEFEIEKELRNWRIAFDLLDTKPSDSAPEVIPIVNVRMNPFPGEGVFRKIESIVRAIDPKISIMRSEN
jgi:hypothetical protein